MSITLYSFVLARLLEEPVRVNIGVGWQRLGTVGESLVVVGKNDYVPGSKNRTYFPTRAFHRDGTASSESISISDVELGRGPYGELSVMPLVRQQFLGRGEKSWEALTVEDHVASQNVVAFFDGHSILLTKGRSFLSLLDKLDHLNAWTLADDARTVWICRSIGGTLTLEHYSIGGELVASVPVKPGGLGASLYCGDLVQLDRTHLAMTYERPESHAVYLGVLEVSTGNLRKVEALKSTVNGDLWQPLHSQVARVDDSRLAYLDGQELVIVKWK